jgi:hypothetical protein
VSCLAGLGRLKQIVFHYLSAISKFHFSNSLSIAGHGLNHLPIGAAKMDIVLEKVTVGIPLPFAKILLPC